MFFLLLLFSKRKYLFAFVFAGLGFVSTTVNRPVQVFGSILEERRVGQTDAFALQGWQQSWRQDFVNKLNDHLWHLSQSLTVKIRKKDKTVVSETQNVENLCDVRVLASRQVPDFRSHLQVRSNLILDESSASVDVNIFLKNKSYTLG